MDILLKSTFFNRYLPIDSKDCGLVSELFRLGGRVHMGPFHLTTLDLMLAGF